MNIVFEVTNVICEGVTERKCLSSDVDEVIKVSKGIMGDYNVTVWIDGKWYDLYMDPEEDEIREIYNQALIQYS